MPAGVMGGQPATTIKLEREKFRSNPGEPGTRHGEEESHLVIVQLDRATDETENVRFEKARTWRRRLEFTDAPQDSGRELRGDRVDETDEAVAEHDVAPISA